MADLTKARTRYDDRSALGAIEITPSDADDLSRSCKALYIGSTGNVRVTTISGDVATFASVPVGILPVVVTKVWSTGTTASSIVGLY